MDAPSTPTIAYPFGSDGPAPGVVRDIADGLGWLRLEVPGPLRHVNCWLIDGAGNDLTIVDTGMDTRGARDGWTAAFAGALAGRRVERVIGTHFHPDHIGLAGWLCDREDAPLWMTRGEWFTGRLVEAQAALPADPAFLDFWRMAGWSDAQLATLAAGGWRIFREFVTPMPFSYRRIVEGETLALGAREWRIVTGCGHSPEHACLLDEAAGILISGDQVLPRISSNISLGPIEPEGDPLGDWLRSIAKLKLLPGDLLVLPGHGEPFTGLHVRLDALAAEHHQRLDDLEQALERHARAVDCFTTLFSRPIGDDMIGMATGETLAHLRHLEVEGRAKRETVDGVAWWSRT